MKYTAEIKEVGKTNILKTSLSDIVKTKDELIQFWGLDNDDVEWYKIYEVKDNGEKIEL